MVAFKALTEDQRADIVRRFQAGDRAAAIQKAIPVTAQTYRRVLKEAGVVLKVGGNRVKRQIEFDVSEDWHASGPSADAPPPPPRRDLDECSTHSAPDELLEVDDASSASATETFRSQRLPRPPGAAEPANPFTRARPDALAQAPARPDALAQAAAVPWDTQSERSGRSASSQGSRSSHAVYENTAYENTALAPGNADPERAILLLQVRLYAADFPERLGESVIGRSKQAQKRFHESLERMDSDELRKVLGRCEMAVASSNTHEVLMGGLSMALRATESAGGMLRLRLAGYHDRMMSSPAVESLVKELRIKHIATLQQYSSPEQRLGGILLMGLVATDSHNRFREQNEKELGAEIPAATAQKFADL